MAIENGLSDFSKLSLMVIKVLYKNQKSNLTKYRSYNNFDNEAFASNLQFAFFEYVTEMNFYVLKYCWSYF